VDSLLNRYGSVFLLLRRFDRTTLIELFHCFEWWYLALTSVVFLATHCIHDFKDGNPGIAQFAFSGALCMWLMTLSLDASPIIPAKLKSIVLVVMTVGLIHMIISDFFLDIDLAVSLCIFGRCTDTKRAGVAAELQVLLFIGKHTLKGLLTGNDKMYAIIKSDMAFEARIVEAEATQTQTQITHPPTLLIPLASLSGTSS